MDQTRNALDANLLLLYKMVNVWKPTMAAWAQEQRENVFNVVIIDWFKELHVKEL